jgi:quercetin dioxygenase-like cupin family protein
MGVDQIHDQMSGIFEVDLQVIHNFSEGVYAKQMSIPAGYVVGQHAHTFDHLSILAQGKVIVKTDTVEKEYTAPACIEITKYTRHMITAIEDSVWFCVHATDVTDPSKIDDVLIHKG